MHSEFYVKGPFLCLDGPAKKAGRSFANVKVCITCRDSELLSRLLVKAAQDPECYWVKMSSQPRDGMFLGRCFFTAREHAGSLWAKYKTHPRLMVTLQDDDFAQAYRDAVVSWQGKPADAID